MKKKITKDYQTPECFEVAMSNENVLCGSTFPTEMGSVIESFSNEEVLY